MQYDTLPWCWAVVAAPAPGQPHDQSQQPIPLQPFCTHTFWFSLSIQYSVSFMIYSGLYHQTDLLEDFVQLQANVKCSQHD